MKLFRIFLFLMLIIPCFAFADDNDKNLEITIYSGLSFLEAEQEFPVCIYCREPVEPQLDQFYQGNQQTIDNSFLFGFKTGYYFNRNMEIEGNFNIGPGHDVRNEIFDNCPPGVVCPLYDQPVNDLYYPYYYYPDQNAVAYNYDANFVYNFNFESVRPFFTVGIGGVSTDVENDVRNDFSFNFGGGAKFNFKDFGLRFELNDKIIPDYWLTSETEHNLQIQYGFLFRL